MKFLNLFGLFIRITLIYGIKLKRNGNTNSNEELKAPSIHIYMEHSDRDERELEKNFRDKEKEDQFIKSTLDNEKKEINQFYSIIKEQSQNAYQLNEIMLKNKELIESI